MCQGHSGNLVTSLRGVVQTATRSPPQALWLDSGQVFSSPRSRRCMWHRHVCLMPHCRSVIQISGGRMHKILFSVFQPSTMANVTQFINSQTDETKDFKCLFFFHLSHYTQAEFTAQLRKSRSTLKVVLWCRYLGWSKMQDSEGTRGRCAGSNILYVTFISW